MHKLKHLGVRNVHFDWFNSYLSNRNQYVNINGVDSLLSNMTCETPQGSLLGALLFLIYMNDIGEMVKYAKIRLLAVDTNVFILLTIE